MLGPDQMRHFTGVREQKCDEVLFVTVRVQNLNVFALHELRTPRDQPRETLVLFTDHMYGDSEAAQFLSESAVVEYDRIKANFGTFRKGS